MLHVSRQTYVTDLFMWSDGSGWGPVRGGGGGGIFMSPVWISNLSTSQFQKAHMSLSEFRPKPLISLSKMFNYRMFNVYAFSLFCSRNALQVAVDFTCLLVAVVRRHFSSLVSTFQSRQPCRLSEFTLTGPHDSKVFQIAQFIILLRITRRPRLSSLRISDNKSADKSS